MPNTVVKFSSEAALALDQGFGIYDVTEVYQVTAANDSDGPTEILADAQLPQPGTVVTIAGTGAKAYCDRVSATRPHNHLSKKLWYVTAHFTNRSSNQNDGMPVGETGEHIQNPTDTPQQVSFTFANEYEPAQKAELLRVEDEFETSHALNPRLYGYKGFICNSAGEPQPETAQKKRKLVKTVNVTRVVDSWDNTWETLVNTVNDAAVTITQKDTTEKLSQTFNPGELLLLGLSKDDQWIGGVLYYRVTFKLLVDTVNLHWVKHPDTGTYADIWGPELDGIGQYVQDLGLVATVWTNYTDNAAKMLKHKLPFKSDRPLPMNGYGNAQNKKRPESAAVPPSNQVAQYGTRRFFQVFKIYEDADFSSLGIT